MRFLSLVFSSWHTLRLFFTSSLFRLTFMSSLEMNKTGQSGKCKKKIRLNERTYCLHTETKVAKDLMSGGDCNSSATSPITASDSMTLLI